MPHPTTARRIGAARLNLNPNKLTRGSPSLPMPDERDSRQDLQERRTRPIGLGIGIAVGVFVLALVLFLLYYFLTA